jgi:hypothetical protein
MYNLNTNNVITKETEMNNTQIIPFTTQDGNRLGTMMYNASKNEWRWFGLGRCCTKRYAEVEDCKKSARKAFGKNIKFVELNQGE